MTELNAVEPNPSTVETARVLFEETRRQLERQESSLSDVRRQSTWLLTAAALTNGLFAAYGAHHHAAWRTALTVIAVSAFVATAALVLWVQRPREYVFRGDLAEGIADTKRGEPWRPLDLYTEMAVQFQSYRKKNEPLITRRYDLYGLGCVLLALQVACWAIAAI